MTRSMIATTIAVIMIIRTNRSEPFTNTFAPPITVSYVPAYLSIINDIGKVLKKR